MIKNYDINCCSCSACINICPNDAISLKMHKNGYDYPVINTSKCINCNKCSSVCQIYKKHNRVVNNLTTMVFSEQHSNHSDSSSGGFCYQFAKLFIENGGIVYSSFFDKVNQRISLGRYSKTNLSSLDLIRGSKYAKTYLGNSFKAIKQDLDSRLNVCVIAMPCEIYGLILFLGKKYSNLTTISLLCGGSVSSNYFSVYLKELSEKYRESAVNINFRDKKYGPIGYLTSIQLDSKKVYPYPKNDAYVKILSSDFVRASCKQCNFGPNNFPSNLMVCDFHEGSKVGNKTLVLLDEITQSTKDVLDLMGSNIKEISLSSLKGYVAYRGLNKQRPIDDDLYIDFYESLIKKGIYKTVKRFIYKDLTFRQKVLVRAPYYLRGMFYGNKK